MWQKLSANNSLRSLVSYGGLFTSFGTLLCCAIPSALVLLGFGAGLASFLGEFPQLIWLSENKELVFGTSFFMLGISFLGQKLSQKMECPIDQREACSNAKNWSRPLLIVTLFINLIGAFSAFVLPRLL